MLAAVLRNRHSCDSSIVNWGTSVYHKMVPVLIYCTYFPVPQPRAGDFQDKVSTPMTPTLLNGGLLFIARCVVDDSTDIFIYIASSNRLVQESCRQNLYCCGSSSPAEQGHSYSF